MTRTEIINHFIAKNNYRSYLEIGVHNGVNFGAIKCANKVGVDPDQTSKATEFKTSDSFFKDNAQIFDIVFLDGLHTAIQLYKDIINSLDCLSEKGVIVIHDLLPPNKKAQEVPRIQGEWTGDCWLAFTWLRATREDLFMYTIAADYGVGVIQKGKQDILIISENITYDNFEKNKSHWLNLHEPAYLSGA